jgi:hypothetical protein
MSSFSSLLHDEHCGCTGRDGRPKRLYPSRVEALNCAAYLLETQGVRLRVYECPYCSGYHLTSDLNGRRGGRQRWDW